MSFFDSYKKGKEAGQGKTEKAKDPSLHKAETGPDITAILRDPERSHLFGAMLERFEKEGEETVELSKRLAEGKLEGKDLEQLEKFRIYFNEVSNRAAEVAGSITPELIARLAYHSPGLKKIIGLVGPDKVTHILKQEIGELAHTDPSNFESISVYLDNLAKFQGGELKEAEKRIQQTVKKYGVNQDSYREAMLIEDPDKRSKALQKIVREKFGKLKTALDLASFRTISEKKAFELDANRGDIENTVLELDQRMKMIGDALDFTISNNDSVRSAVSREISGKSPEITRKQSFSGAMATALTEEKFNEEWQTEKRGISGWEKLDEGEKEKRFEEFKKKRINKEEEKKKEGFWSLVNSTFSIPLIGSRKLSV
ncbi:MAG: hypothetical protein PHS53_04055 [Candidatus Pacebacteria bacterium]|nr:hypothetical protein [Candidatus Paceibacterota bacterium]MDD5357292.1 hypothetical protein [Candidatus Paceibacterota bacterium]